MLVTVYSPKNKVFDKLEAKAVYLPSVSGDMQILNNHIPVIAALKKGKIVIDKENNEKVTLELDHGYVQFADNQMTLVIVETKLTEKELKELELDAEGQRGKEIREEEEITEEEFEEMEISEGHK